MHFMGNTDLGKCDSRWICLVMTIAGKSLLIESLQRMHHDMTVGTAYTSWVRREEVSSVNWKVSP
jgi:hypothetical protein